MYQNNDRVTQLFTKCKYIWLWLQCFDPYLGHRQAYIMNLESIEHVWHEKPQTTIKQPTATTARNSHQKLLV
jgi:hypothetical protein